VLEHIGRVAFDAPAAAVPDYFIAMDPPPPRPDNHQNNEEELVRKLKAQFETAIELTQLLHENSEAIEQLKTHIRESHASNADDGTMSALLEHMIQVQRIGTKCRDLALNYIGNVFLSHRPLFWQALYQIEF
jgi:hypothetical protein